MHRLGGLLFGQLPVANQRQQRVALLRGVEVEHEPEVVGRHRREREELRRGRLLQVDHQAHHAWLVLAGTHASDEGVVGAHLADQVAQRRAELQAVDVDHQAARVLGDEVLLRER